MMTRLSKEQVAAIQQATEEVLESVSLRVQHDGLLRRARGEGKDRR
ncbi:MAG: hypothetical protein JSV65_11300 [Armatimonadota bacterium]|nr:MAG: hypothetical protein JSV65_11300 [Armatimonadota bacterium]